MSPDGTRIRKTLKEVWAHSFFPHKMGIEGSWIRKKQPHIHAVFPKRVEFIQQSRAK